MNIENDDELIDFINNIESLSIENSTHISTHKEENKEVEEEENKIYFEDLEALYNYTILNTGFKIELFELNINTDNLTYVEIFNEKIFIDNNVDYDVFITLLTKINFFKMLSMSHTCIHTQSTYKVLYHDISKLFEDNDLHTINPYDATIKLIALGVYFNVWKIIYPNFLFDKNFRDLRSFNF